jgi:hypothetical protein
MPVMTRDAPLSYHRDLYRYWDGKRDRRPLAGRRDIDPAEICRLLPFLGLVDGDRAGYRWRLMGTAIAADLGRDLTGQRFGAFVAPPEFVAAMARTFDRVLAECQPMLEESIYKTAAGRLLAVSRLLLPLATADGVPRIVIFSRLTRPLRQTGEERESLQGATGRITGSHAIANEAGLAAQSAAWEAAAAGLTPAAPRAAPLVTRIAGLWGPAPPCLLHA